VLDSGAHQLVPGGVELDLVDPVAVAVVGAQLRRVLVGQPAPFLRPLAAGQAAQLGERGERGVVRVPPGRLDEDGVTRDRVVADQRRNLVGDLVGRADGKRLPTGSPVGGCSRDVAAARARPAP
jgi:hypothetical protein